MTRAVPAAMLCLAAGMAGAHDGVDHATEAEAARHGAAAPLSAPTPLPFDIGGPFRLIDQDGATRTGADPAGRYQLLFFGYANCLSICSVAMPTMAAAVDLLSADGMGVVPVMITVDPARDTVATMGPALAPLHPDFVGLTGDAEALGAAHEAFRVESRVVFEDPEHGPVFAHGSHVYLLAPDGEVLTLLPPILSPDRMAEIVANYVRAGAG